MNAKLSGLFSGFPAHHFTDEIALVLRENLPRRESLVFISAWPEDIPCDGIYRLTPLCPPHLLHNNRTLSSHPSIKA